MPDPTTTGPDNQTQLQRLMALGVIPMQPQQVPLQPTDAAKLTPMSAPTLQPVGQPISPGGLQKINLAGDPADRAPLTRKEQIALPTASPGVPAGSLASNQAKLEKLQLQDQGTPWNERSGWSKLGHVASKIGNIAGDVLIPRVMATIPGTELNRTLQEQGLQGEINTQQKEQNTEENAKAERGIQQENADIEKLKAGKKTIQEQYADAVTDAQGRGVDPATDPKVQQLADAQTSLQKQPAVPTHYEKTDDGSVMAITTDPNTGKSTSNVVYKGDPKVESDVTTRIVNGVPHSVLINKQTGADIKDLGQTKVPGETPDQKRSASESAQVEREARGAIRKAETDFRNAQAVADEQHQFIREAKGGNKEAVKIVPLEGALEITTAQGVHRINRTEVDQYGNAGSYFDRITGAIGNGLTGRQIPDNVLNDMDAMTSQVEKNAYSKYVNDYKDNAGIVSGYGGTGFEGRVPMIGAPAQAQSGGTQPETQVHNGFSYTKGADGQWHKGKAVQP